MTKFVGAVNVDQSVVCPYSKNLRQMHSLS